jgi:hypothetical protein
MTSGDAFNAPRGSTVSRAMIIQFIVLYIFARATYVRIALLVKWITAKADITPIDDEAGVAGSQKPQERIRIRYAVGQLSATTCSAVVLAILGTFFVVWLTQGPLVDGVRIVISLILGGVGPAVVLHALSYSVPAAEEPPRYWIVQKAHELPSSRDIRVSLSGRPRHAMPVSAGSTSG